MTVNNYHVNAGKGVRLFCTSWQQPSSAKAVLFIVHGLGEHSGRYEEIAEVLVKKGIACFAFDHRGHGKSGGKRGHAQSIEQLIEDTEFALMKCRNLFLDIPIFMMGHSMGGQIVATFINKANSKEISGAIISSAWFRLVSPPPSWQIKLIYFLKSIAPRICLSNKLDSGHISSVKEEVEVYEKDELIHDKISFALFTSLYNNGIEIAEKKSALNIPVLVCHGDLDKITSSTASSLYAKNLEGDTSFVIWHGSYHEPHHDHEKDKVIQFYADWILEKLS